MHKLTILDRLRGWHWIGTDKVRNWCLCHIHQKGRP